MIRERKALEPKPGPSKAPPTPKRKVIKTRFNGVVVGEPRAAESGLVDVKAPVTGKIIATFHEKPQGSGSNESARPQAREGHRRSTWA